MKLALHSYWRSSCSYRIRIVLQFKKINYEYKTVNLLEKIKNPNDFGTLNERNPMGQIPVLEVEHDNKRSFLVQSLPIIEWLEESYPGTYSIFPKDPLLRQKTRAMSEVINSGIQPLQNLGLLEEIEKNGGNKVEWAKKVINKGFAALEKMVKETGGKYCVGDNVTLVDCCLIPQIYNAKRFGVEVEKYEQLNKIYSNCLELEEFIKACPESQPDYPGPGK